VSRDPFRGGGRLSSSQKPFKNVVACTDSFGESDLIYALSDNVAAADETFHGLFASVQEHFIAYCRCREAVKLFRFQLSPYSLVETCNSVQNYGLRWQTS
jgi:hypothetical protein